MRSHASSLRTGLALAIVLAAAAGTLRADDSPLTAEERAAFAWFDTLGFPDVARPQLVKVATGKPARDGNPSSPKNTFIAAFVLEEKGDEFTVFSTDLTTQTFTRTQPGTADEVKVEHEPLDPKQALAVITEAKRVSAWADRWSGYANDVLSERAQLFVVARALAARGDDARAHELWQRVVAFQDPRAKGKTTAKAVEDDVATILFSRAVRALADPEVPRAEVLRSLRLVADRCAQSDHAKECVELAATLERMIAEDASHAPPAAPFDRLTPAERAAELVFQLRDQNGSQWYRPGTCDIFADPRGEASPALRLVALGWDSVPALVDALEQKTLTRSVGFGRGPRVPHHVSTVGECALAILERVIGSRLMERALGDLPTDPAARARLTKERLRAWWVEFQKRGELGVLTDATAEADVEQAGRLVERYPNEALEPLTRALRRPGGEWEHGALIELVGRLEGDGALRVLVRVLACDPMISARVAAARALCGRGVGEAVAAMIVEWGALPRAELDGSGGDALVRFLASSGEPDAIAAIAARFGEISAVRRFDFVNVVSQCSAMPDVARNERFTAAIEELLVGELDDLDERTGLSGSWNGKSFADPRIGDWAAGQLAQRWPERYAFDLGATTRERDQARAAIKTTWRKARGLAPAPDVAQLAPIERLAPAEAERLIGAVLAAPSAESRQAAIDALEARGLAALEAVEAATSKLESSHAAREPLVELAARLDTIVREVVVAPGSIAPTGELKRLLDDATGRRLTSERLLALASAFVKTAPPIAGALKLTAERGESGEGVTITVAQRIEGGGQSHMTARVSLAKSMIANAANYGAIGATSAMWTWARESFAKPLDQALASPARTPFEARFTIAR